MGLPNRGRIKLSLLLAQKRRYEQEVVSALEVFDGASTGKSIAEREKAEANEALRTQSDEVFREYGARINALLERFMVGFKIIPQRVNFLGGPPAVELAIEIKGERVSSSVDDARDPSRPSLANTLSGGDRSALALSYFIAVTEHDPEIEKSIVVFDDPFHSQDRSRRRRTVECIHRIASRARQSYVLSHDLDFAREMAHAPGIPVATFTLDPLSEDAELKPESLPALPGRAYERDFGRLLRYADKPQEETDHKGVARCIRQTLEAYLRTKFPDIWKDDEWLGGMILAIRNAVPGDRLHRARHLADPLSHVNEWGKRYYHSEQDGSARGEVDPVELRGYVAQAIEIVST